MRNLLILIILMFSFLKDVAKARARTAGHAKGSGGTGAAGRWGASPLKQVAFAYRLSANFVPCRRRSVLEVRLIRASRLVDLDPDTLYDICFKH